MAGTKKCLLLRSTLAFELGRHLFGKCCKGVYFDVRLAVDRYE